jgi:hypothetical protein
MNRLEAFRELRGLLVEAIASLGEQRVALGVGCDLSTVRAWHRRTQTHLQARTIGRALPRLRRWQSWVFGYRAEGKEIQRLHEESPATWADQTTELRQLIHQGLQGYSLRQLALGCELPESRLVHWSAGHFEAKHHADVVQALGHLRGLETWPTPIGQPVEEAEGTPA